MYSVGTWEQFELESDQLENDFYLQDRALRKLLRVTEQALKAQLATEETSIASDTALNSTQAAEKKAALKVAYETQVADVKASFAKKKEEAKFAMKLKQEDLRFLEEQARLNETYTFTETFVASLPNATQGLLLAEQQKEKDALARKKVERKTKLWEAHLATATNATNATLQAEFQTYLSNEAATIGCNATCVSECAAS